MGMIYAGVEGCGEEGVDRILVVMKPITFWRVDRVGGDGEGGGVREESCDDVRNSVV